MGESVINPELPEWCSVSLAFLASSVVEKFTNPNPLNIVLIR